MADERTTRRRGATAVLLAALCAAPGCLRWTTGPSVPAPAPNGLAARPIRVVYLGRQYPYEPRDYFERLRDGLQHASGRKVTIERSHPNIWYPDVHAFPHDTAPPRAGELTVLLQPVAAEAFYEAHLGPEWPGRAITLVVPIVDHALVTWSITLYGGPDSKGERFPVFVERHEVAWMPAVVIAPLNFAWEQNANEVLLDVLPSMIAEAAPRVPAS